MSTNYFNAFIAVADDCPVITAEVPPDRAGAKTVAGWQYQLIMDNPYQLTSDDVIFEVYARRQGISPDAMEAERRSFFDRDQACLRSSPLGRRYGWGIHHDGQARVALYAVESDQYRGMLADASLSHLKALRSRRA